MSLFALIPIILFFALFFLLAIAANIISMFVGGIRGILRALGIGGSEQEYEHRNTTTHGHTSEQTSQRTNPVSNGKIFGADEGEYVDFEEIKN